MAYEDPIEAALRALTDVVWSKRKDGRFEARTNQTHKNGIMDTLMDHNIPATAEVSAARSGRYTIMVKAEDVPKVQRAIEKTGANAKPHRKKWQS